MKKSNNKMKKIKKTQQLDLAKASGGHVSPPTAAPAPHKHHR